MRPSEAIKDIECMYKGLPFKDESGRLVYVSDPFDCLINSCELFEKVLFKDPTGLTTGDNDWFLEQTLQFLESIDIEEFKARAKTLERSVREIVLRNLDKINLKFSDINISQYILALV